MTNVFTNDWQEVLHDQFEAPYYKKLRQFLKQQYASATIYPPKEEVMNALYTTAYEDVRVVILGQDPYHGPNQAQGLSFSVKEGVAIPPSLRNMYKELHDDIGCPVPTHGNLMKWAQQGVLLLNTVLTVRRGEANSHKGQGWETFTDVIIERLAQREALIIFVLWGRPAQQKQAVIKRYSQHVVLTAPHPSPLSAHRGFFGSKPYSQINKQLQAWGEQPIDWCL